jgi:hypothetical protein
MKRVSLVLLTLVITMFSMACKSPKDRLDDRDYEGAFESALKNLNKSKDKKENLLVLRKALSKLYNAHERNHASLSQVSPLETKATVADECTDLLDKIDRARDYIHDDSLYHYKEIYEENKILKNEVGNQYQKRAGDALQELKSTYNKSLAPTIYKDLERAEYYLGPNTDVRAYKEETLRLGTIIINVEADAWGSDYSNYDIGRVFGALNTVRTTSPLTKIYYQGRLSTEQIDCQINLRLGRIDYNESRNETSRNFSEKIEDGFDVKKDANGNEVKVQRYKTITATVYTTTTNYRMELPVESTVNGKAPNCTLTSNRWYSREDYKVDQHRITGDSRAVPSSYRNSTQNIKSRQQLSEEILQQAYREFLDRYF